MANNIDRSLDDIISEQRTKDGNGHSNSNKQGGGQSGRRRHHNSSTNSGNNSGRNSPYTRNRDSAKGRGHGHDKWRHDLYDGPKTINDRLGPQAKSIDSRLGDNAQSSNNRRAKQKDNSMGKGLTIAGRTRDTKPYDEMRVVFATGLPRNYAQEQIERVFGDVGRIDHIRMGIDKNSRFIGKAEITYRLSEDARSAIQLFDGETLYGTESSLLNKIEIRYSNPENARMLERVKFEDSLPTPRALPMQSRLGGVGASALASAAMMAAAHQQQQEQMMAMVMMNSGSNRRNQRSQDNQGRGQQRHNNGNRNHHNKPEVTAQELDDDLDSYMNESNSNPALAGESAQ